MSKFRIDYDDRPDDIIDKINQALITHGLSIIKIEDPSDEEEESQHYKIVKFLPDEG
jgi:hypothetical protein